jgi:hypothetical protein
VYAIDDVFVAYASPALHEAAPQFESGIYHYPCFRSSPHRDKVLKVFAEAGKTVWPADTAFLTTLARDTDFALTLRPFTGTSTLHFIPWGRQLELSGPNQWQAFRNLVVGPAPAEPTAAGWRGQFRLRWDRGGWELAQRLLIPIDADLEPRDLARLRQHLSARDIDPARTPVKLGALCFELNIAPSEVSCPLERLTGTFTWPDGRADPAALVTVTVQVEKAYTIPLTSKELDALRRFLQSRFLRQKVEEGFAKRLTK